MKTDISKDVDRWIDEESHPRFKMVSVVRTKSPWYGMTEEDIEDRREFIRHYLFKAFELLLLIPVPSHEDDFWHGNHQDFLESAFNTHDFQRGHSSFDRYDYRLRKILEEVKDLALLHSCISQPEGRENIRSRFDALVENEFRAPLLSLFERHRRSSDEDQRLKLRLKVAKLSRNMSAARKIWEQISPWEDSASQINETGQTSSAGQEEVFHNINDLR